MTRHDAVLRRAHVAGLTYSVKCQVSARAISDMEDWLEDEAGIGISESIQGRMHRKGLRNLNWVLYWEPASQGPDAWEVIVVLRNIESTLLFKLTWGGQ